MTPQWDAIPDHPRMLECEVCNGLSWESDNRKRYLNEKLEEVPYVHLALPSTTLTLQFLCPHCGCWFNTKESHE